MYMEHLEEKLQSTAPLELKPKVWKRYEDDILQVIKKGSVEKLTEFFNSLDVTGSIKFTYEVEQDGKLPYVEKVLEAIVRIMKKT